MAASVSDNVWMGYEYGHMDEPSTVVEYIPSASPFPA